MSDPNGRSGRTHPSLIDARLAVVTSDVAKFTLRIRHMRRHRNRLWAEVRKRSLAGFVRVDGDGIDLGAEGLVLALRREIRRRAVGDASGRGQAVGHDEVVQVHGFRRGNMVFGRFSQLGNTTGGIVCRAAKSFCSCFVPKAAKSASYLWLLKSKHDVTYIYRGGR